MPTPENPYHSPKTSPVLPKRNRSPLISYTRLNIAIATTLPILLLAEVIWGDHLLDHMAPQELPRRYASYDHEYSFHFNPVGGLLMLGLIFAIPNRVLFAIKFTQRKQA